MRKFTLYILLFAFMSAKAQVDVTAFNSGTAEGVTYYLPDTYIDITVEARCVTRTPGEFSRFAERFLHIKDAIFNESKEWELTNIKVKNGGTPNRQKAFTVGVGSSVASNIVLDENGVILAINQKIEKETVEPAAVKKATKSVDTRTYLTEEIMQATSTAKMAELVAKEIYTIRESKLAITRGLSDNMPKDGLSMQLVLDELNLQEKTLTELFIGRSDTVMYTSNIRFTPGENSDTLKAVLFRFSRKLGILENDNLAGAPIYYDFEIEKAPVVPIDDSAKKKKTIKKEGICYTQPGRALFKIYRQGETYFEERLPFGQFGTIEVLSKKMFVKDNDIKVLFDGATGGIISIDK